MHASVVVSLPHTTLFSVHGVPLVPQSVEIDPSKGPCRHAAPDVRVAEPAADLGCRGGVGTDPTEPTNHEIGVLSTPAAVTSMSKSLIWRFSAKTRLPRPKIPPLVAESSPGTGCTPSYLAYHRPCGVHGVLPVPRVVLDAHHPLVT